MGRLADCYQTWLAITQDAWVLQKVRGFHIVCREPGAKSHPIQFSAQDVALVDEEVASLLHKGAISLTSPHPRGFLSNVFLVDKTDGGKRPVINLSEFNKWLVYRHFKMEGIHLLRNVLRPIDWMARLDLEDTYLVIPIFQPHRQFLQFAWRHCVYEFTALPFGLSSAPWCFTKVLNPVVEFLRARGIRMIVYLDNLLLMASCPRQLTAHLQMAVFLLQDLGFVINERKSLLQPAQSVTFLGFIIDSTRSTLSSSQEGHLNPSRVALCSGQTTGVPPAAGPGGGPFVSFNSGHLPGPAPLQGSSAPQSILPSQRVPVPSQGCLVRRSKGRNPLVARSSGSLERPSDLRIGSGPCYRIRCQQAWLGGPGAETSLREGCGHAKNRDYI